MADCQKCSFEIGFQRLTEVRDICCSQRFKSPEIPCICKQGINLPDNRSNSGKWLTAPIENRTGKRGISVKVLIHKECEVIWGGKTTGVVVGGRRETLTVAGKA